MKCILNSRTTALDGKWGPWSGWSEAEGLTNPESVIRVRNCDDPAPLFGGKYCQGDSVEVETRFTREFFIFISCLPFSKFYR